MVRAVDGGDGATPEPLAGHEPVAQPVVDLAFAEALLFEPVDGTSLGRRDVEAVEEAAVDLDTVARVRLSPAAVPVGGRLHRAHDRKLVLRGESPVPRVLGGHGHDGSGPVPHEHVVGHVDGHRVAGERIDDAAAGEGTALAQRDRITLRHALDVGGSSGPRAQRVDGLALGGGGQRIDERVLGRHHGIGHAEAGVRAGREHPHGQVGAPLDGEIELGALGSPDPVALHRLGPLRPLEAVEGFEELVGVLGDAEEPLLQVPLDDEVARALTGAVGQHLLVGQHGLAPRAPVDRCQGPVGQPGLPELQEDGLAPLDVRGVVAVDLAAPVVDGTEPAQRRRELGDPGVGEDPRMGPGLDCGVLSREAEGVEPDRAQDALAQHGLVADRQVPEGVIPHVALVRRP